MSTTDELTVKAINRRRPVIKPTMSGEELEALEEVEDFYAPSAVIRAVSTYFRSGPGAGFSVGHGQYFDFDHVVGRLLGIRGLATAYSSQVYGGGKGLDLHDTYVSSMGEGVERVLGSLAFLDWGDSIRFGSYDELTTQGLRCLAPEEAPIFAAHQYADPHFPFDRWEHDTPLGWIPGQRLYSGEEILVPAQLVLFVYYRMPEEPRIGLAPSGGLSSHINRDKALLHAVLELIERDAVNLRWHCKIPLDRIRVDTTPRDPQLRSALEHLDDLIGQPTFYVQNLDFPTVPVLTAIQFDEWLTRQAYNAGGGVGTTLDLALRSALAEYCQSERSIRICQLARNWRFVESFTSLFGIEEDATAKDFARYIQAITYYGYPRQREATRWFFEDGDEVCLSELYAQVDKGGDDPYQRVRDALEHRGIDPIIFDFTPRDFRTTRVMKAFIPKLSQPYPQQAPALGHPRFQHVPVVAGRREEPLQPEELLADPLPYP